MPAKPFFEDADSPFFDSAGMPLLPGLYEFRRSDGRKILYTLGLADAETGEAPRLKVIRASRMEDYPYPAHALHSLDGSWIRFIGPRAGNADASEDGAADPGSPPARA